MNEDKIQNIFQHHKPSGNQTERYLKIREACKVTALIINRLAPESREKSLAFTHIQSAMMWANAAIAINENPEAITNEDGPRQQPEFRPKDVEES